MDINELRKYCLSFPHTTENVQWEDVLCLKVAGKLFAVIPLCDANPRVSFKCSADNFAALCERPGIRPAPYLARAQWVRVEEFDALQDSELRELLAEAYRLVWDRIPKKQRVELTTRNAKGRANSIKRRPSLKDKVGAASKGSVATSTVSPGAKGSVPSTPERKNRTATKTSPQRGQR